MNCPRFLCSLIWASKARRFAALTFFLARMLGTATPKAMAAIIRDALSPFTPAAMKLFTRSPSVIGTVKSEKSARYISTPGTIGMTLDMART